MKRRPKKRLNGKGKSPPWAIRVPGAVLREDPTPDPEGREYDREERTGRFGGRVIDLCKRIPLGPSTDRLIDQVRGCGTSVGGNDCEAGGAVSGKEFIKIIGTCRKESREPRFLLRRIARARPALADEARDLRKEANELHLIFSGIRRSAMRNPVNNS